MNRNDVFRSIFLTLILLGASSVYVAQEPKETPPPPSEPRKVNIPDVEKVELINGLTIVVINKPDLPLVTVSLMIRGGSGLENVSHAGLAEITAEMLAKGTELRNATQIAEEMEFLGASFDTNADWNSSTITVNVMKDKLPKAMAIMADSVIRPTFPADELNLAKSRRIDGLKVRLNQPGPLLSYVASRFSYGEHAANGTPESIDRIRTRDVETYHYANYHPKNAVLVFTGDITKVEAIGFGKLFFGGWTSPKEARVNRDIDLTITSGGPSREVISRFLVVDLPDSGQAAVAYSKKVYAGRISCKDSDLSDCGPNDMYYTASVLNSVLGGGYSARLNQEIRIKRGLSYGARSGFDWRSFKVNFSASTQTKNESAAEVASLIEAEINKLAAANVEQAELVPRKAVVTGGFGRGLQTNNGLAARIRDLYLYGLDPGLLNIFVGAIQDVSGDEIRKYAKNNLFGGDMIIVGDAKLFMDDLTKRFPNRTIEVMKVENVDLNSRDLRKGGR